MRRGIHLENSSKNIVRVLSITDESAVENSPNGLRYILIDNYTPPPEMKGAMDVSYPLYNKTTGEFMWKSVEYQHTSTENTIEVLNLKEEVLKLEEQNTSLQEVVDTLLIESLGGV